MTEPDEGKIVIRTERLLLRRLKQEDAADIFLIRSSPEAMKWTATLPEISVTQSEAWVAGCLGRADCFNFVIELLPSEETPNLHANGGEQHISRPGVIGVVGAIRTPEIGYLLHPDYWNRGIATEALKAFMRVYWEHVSERYDHAKADADPDHVGSRKVLEKAGFSLWEVKREDFHSPVLGLRDTALYRIARPGTSLERQKQFVETASRPAV